MGSSSASPDRTRVLLMIALVFVVALGVRIAHYARVRSTPLYVFPTLDERGNHEFALAILHDQVPAAAYYKAPLYTYFLAGVYAVLGEDSLRARLVQCILASLSPVLTAMIGWRVFGRTVGLVAGLWSAVFWTFVFFSTELLDVALASLLYLWLAYGLVSWDDRRWTKWLACGVLLGLGAITRPNILAFAPVLAAMVLIVGWRNARIRASAAGFETAPSRRLRRPILSAIALTMGCCGVVLPITLRNRIVGGEWVLLGAYSGLNLHVANNPYSDSKDGPLLVDESVFLPTTTWDPNEPWARCCLNFKNAYRYAEARLGRKPTRGEFSALLGSEARQYIRHHPDWFARHALRRFCWLFNAYESPSNKDLYHFLRFSKILRGLSYMHYGWLAPLGLVGMGLALSRRSAQSSGLAYLVAMIASLVLPAILFIINSRFRLPMVHLLVVFAAYALVEIVRLIRQATISRRLTLAALALVGLGLFCNLDLFGYRKEHQPYLRLAYAVACMMSERSDLFDQAVADFEHDLIADLRDLQRRGGRSNTTLLVDHCMPMRFLLPYYLQRGDRDKALWAATNMIQREPVDAVWAARLFDIFLEAGQRDLTNKALQLLEQGTAAGDSPDLADRLFRYGRKLQDQAALRRAVALYESLVRLHPGDARLHTRLEETRSAVSQATTRPASCAPAKRLSNREPNPDALR